MGNIRGCSDGCYSWFRGYNETVAKLRYTYRTKYRNTIYYQSCLSLVQNLHTATRNGHTLPDEQSQIFKASLIDSIHYQQSLLASGPSSHSDSQSANGSNLPTRITSLTDEEKKELVSDLIKKSYILLDISDIFSEGEQGIHYQKQVKKKIFQGNDSMMTQSFMDNRQAIVDSLRKFDTSTIFKLQKYVQMAQQIKKSFSTQSESHLSKFLLLLKSNLIQLHNNSLNASQLFTNTHLMISILEATIKILFKLKIKDGNLMQEGKEAEEEVESWGGVQFLNQTNLYTLATCLVFDDQSFHEFFEKAMSDIFRTQLHNYRKQTTISDQAVVSKILGQDKNMNSYFQPTIISLFNKRSQTSQTFQKTIKMFNMLPKKYPPVLKLKLLGEVQKQFLRELKKLCKQKEIQMFYDRSTSQLLANWLINRDKNVGESNIVSIVIAYAFVHGMYRLGSKGSVMLSFVENVERVLGWGIPTQ